MNVDELCEEVRARRRSVLPFVGAGLTVDAGAPSVSDLAEELARRFALEIERVRDLEAVTAAVRADQGLPALQACVAEILAGLRMRPTPALLAVAACPGRLVVTTNYDDAIEAAARARGTKPFSLLAGDPRILEPPAANALHVVHIHGLPAEPSSLVLPGETMDELASDSAFGTFVVSMMIPRQVLYLGFGFGALEGHLRNAVAWIRARVSEPRRQWLLIGDRAATWRSSDLVFFESKPTVDVVNYDDSADHGDVERVALQLAPRAADRAEEPEVDQRLTYVSPVLLRAGADDSPEAVRRRVMALESPFPGRQEEAIDLAGLARERRTVVVAAPGMGKTKLVQWLPWIVPDCATGRLADLRVHDTDCERAVLRLLRDPDSDQRISAEQWEQGELVVLLDGLDELEPHEQDAAAEVICSAADARPGHRFIVTSRPVASSRRPIAARSR